MLKRGALKIIWIYEEAESKADGQEILLRESARVYRDVEEFLQYGILRKTGLCFHTFSTTKNLARQKHNPEQSFCLETN